MPVALAIKTLMFGQVFLGGLFAACFFRSLCKGWFAAAVGGVLYIFGCMLGQIFWPSEVSTLVWLPFLMWCVERFAQTGLRRWWAAFTIGVAMQALAGFPQFMVYTFYLLGPYTLMRLVQQAYAKRQAGIVATVTRQTSKLLAGCVLAVGLAAIQLLPTSELARNTARGNHLSERDVHYLEAERNKYLTLDRFFCNVFDPSAKMITFDFPDGSGYLGMMTPLLVGLGILLGRRDRRVRFFATVALISFVLAFGYNDVSGWLYRLYACLPTGNMFRTPSRLLLLTYFSLICLAVFGLDSVAGGLRELSGRPVLRFIAAGLAVALMIAAKTLSGEQAGWLAAESIALIFVSYVVANRPIALTAIRGLLLALLLFDLADATAPYGSLRDIPIEWGQRPHWGSASPISPEAVADAARHAGLDRISLPGLRPTKLSKPPSPFYSINEYEPLLPERWHWANKCLGGEPGFIMCMVDPDRHAGFYDMAGVAHLFRTSISNEVRRQIGDAEWEIRSRVPLPPPAGMQTTFEHRPSALPRAYTVGHYEVCEPAAAIHRWLALNFDYRDGVLIESWPPMPQLPPSVPGTSRQLADIVSYAPQRVVIRASAAEPRLLVLTDTFFPGWKAYVDGVQSTILRANYLFRAVIVPAGQHEVVFEYRPASFQIGAAISLGSIAILIATLIAGHRMQRRQSR